VWFVSGMPFDGRRDRILNATLSSGESLDPIWHGN
jgi:hypothetical protein